MERHIHRHFYSFLTQHNLLSFTQSGFRKMHSCNTALTINDWYNSFDNGDVIGSVTVDLRKAFDMINFNILLKN